MTDKELSEEKPLSEGSQEDTDRHEMSPEYLLMLNHRNGAWGMFPERL